MRKMPALTQRYSRLARFSGFKHILDAWQQSSAAVAGLGGLGGGLVQQLARFGVARLTLIDRDIVGEENLGHQSLFTAADAGAALPKAEAAALHAAAINPAVGVEARIEEISRHSIDGLLAGCELVFDGLDNYYARLVVNDYCRRGKLPYFYAGVVRGELTAMAVLPGGPCLRCLIDVPPAPGETPTCAAEGVFPPLLGVANALQLDWANRWLAGERPERATLYSLSLPGWELRQLEVARRENCPACAGRYEYLDGTLDSLAAHACSASRVEQQLPPIDLPRVAAQLAAGGLETRLGRLALVAREGGLRYTLFAGGKVVMEGSGDPLDLSRFVAAHLGT
jgi:molybdopterin/thiamine biosynthesis adenylyltransferase